MGLVEPIKISRAKFYCTSVLKTKQSRKNNETGVYEPAHVFTYKFQAVSSGSKENEWFFASTPSGIIELSALKENLFELSEEYYIDFQLARNEEMKSGE